MATRSREHVATEAPTKTLHRPDLFGWSRFDEARNLDFHGVLWRRPEGNVAVDPLPLSPHDLAHVEALGGVRWIALTNSDHVRGTPELVERFGAEVAAPQAERGRFDVPISRWLADGEALVPGLVALELEGSKTPGELAFVLEETTLITGDLVRAHAGGRLDLLPAAKLRDLAAARRSVARLAALPRVEAVLVGDGWPVFRDGSARLRELVASFSTG